MRRHCDNSGSIMMATISVSIVRISSILTVLSMLWTIRSLIAIGLHLVRLRSWQSCCSSGYLTIKGYERRGKLYHLCFPNQEVRQGFSKSLVRYYTAQDMNRYDAIVYAYSKNVLINDDMGAFMPHLKAFYDKFPYTIINNNERHYQAVIFTIFTMLGEDVKVEHTTSDGRIDLVLKTDKSIFIFELKYEKSADTAMAQISGKDYAKAFADDERKVVKVGVNFSEDQRSIEDWVIE